MFSKRFSNFLLWLGLVGFCFPSNAVEQAIKSQVIAHKSVNLSQLNVGQVRRIFSMRQSSWSNGQNITVFVLANDHKTHIAFTTKTLGVFPYQLERVWNKLVYSGLGEQPIRVSSESEMIKRIQELPGAIGYVDQNIELSGVKRLVVVKEKK